MVYVFFQGLISTFLTLLNIVFDSQKQPAALQ